MTATISYSTTCDLTPADVADQAEPEFFAGLLLALPKWTTEFAADIARVINDAEDEDRAATINLLAAIVAAIGEKGEE